MTVSAASDRHGRPLRRQRGFTLLEMTIVLAIVGLVIGMVAPLLGQFLEQQRTSATEDNLEEIEDALVVFVRANGRLPCPAQPEDTPLGTAPNSCTGSGDDGIVPFRTLGLPESTARDGSNNFFSYHVAEDYAAASLNSDITLGFCLETQTLTVEDAATGGSDLAPGQQVAYTLVSHGKNGFGRYSPPNSSRVDANGGSNDEDENTNANDTFVFTGEQTSAATSGSFDDVVHWRTRDQIANDVQEFGCP